MTAPAVGPADAGHAFVLTWHRADECSRRLVKIPGVGPIGAVLRKMKTPEPELFRSGRQFAVGWTPTDHSTAGKVRLGVITRAGGEHCAACWCAGGRGYRRDPACSTRRKGVALAYRAYQTQVAEVGRRGTGQQDRAHRLETEITSRGPRPPYWQAQPRDHQTRAATCPQPC
jgi:hypothetical protein